MLCFVSSRNSIVAYVPGGNEKRSESAIRSVVTAIGDTLADNAVGGRASSDVIALTAEMDSALGIYDYTTVYILE